VLSLFAVYFDMHWSSRRMALEFGCRKRGGGGLGCVQSFSDLDVVHELELSESRVPKIIVQILLLIVE